MCYSAQVYAEFKKFKREFGAIMDIDAYVKVFWWEQGRAPNRRPKMMRAVERELLRTGPPKLSGLIAEWDAREVVDLEQQLFAQRKRVADGQRAQLVKDTKKARDDVRIGTDKVDRALRRLKTIKSFGTEDDAARVFPGVYCPVMVSEGGVRTVRLMRYQCRPAGKPSIYDRKFPGTYNARRDNLEGFWKGQFGHNHGIMVADRFYEHVESPDGQSRILEFVPRTGEPMLVACLWSHWTDPKGEEPDLLSFAAITDEPEPEVAAAGHDRTIINIKPEHIDAWLNPDPGNLEALYAIFEEKRHPFYENIKVT